MKKYNLQFPLLISNCLTVISNVYFSLFSMGMIDHITPTGVVSYIAIETNNGADQNVALAFIGILFTILILMQLLWPAINKLAVNILTIVLVSISFITFLLLQYYGICSVTLTLLHGDKSLAVFFICLVSGFLISVYRLGMCLTRWITKSVACSQ